MNWRAGRRRNTIVVGGLFVRDNIEHVCGDILTLFPMPGPVTHRIAILDLGSNSARAVVVGYIPGERFHLEDELREIVRLREGMTEQGLSAAAMERGLLTLKLFKRFCDALGVQHIVGTATSAVREAANGPEFLQRVEQETGLALRILDGEEEAKFGVLGALNAICLRQGVVLDIGGGSAQVSQVLENSFARGEALTLGALALTERFVHSDPIKKSELRAVKAEIARQLSSVAWLRNTKGSLVGLGGTIRNLAKMAAAGQNYPLESINGYVLSEGALENIIAQLCELPLASRRRIPGLVRDRADIILPGALVLQGLMRHLKLGAVTVSEFGLREGLLFDQFWNREAARRAPNLRAFSVLNLARYHNFHEAHARHVAYLATRLFEQLQPLHGWDDAELDLLHAAALLHDIGMAIKYQDHHKYSQILVLSGALPGFSPREIALIGLLTRYHRKGTPQPGPYASLLGQDDERRLLQLSSLLRAAEYLERGRMGLVKDIEVQIRPQQLTINLLALDDVSVELRGVRQNATSLLELAFQRPVVWEHEPN